MVRERIPLKEGLFTSLDGPDTARLLGGQCPGCGEHHFPAQEVCPYCSATGCRRVPLGSSGSLYVYTAVTNAPPAYTGPVPYGFGVVELPEGLRIVTRLTEAAPDRLAPRMSMHLVIEPLFIDDDGREVWSYAFAPDGEPGQAGTVAAPANRQSRADSRRVQSNGDGVVATSAVRPRRPG